MDWHTLLRQIELTVLRKIIQRELKAGRKEGQAHGGKGHFKEVLNAIEVVLGVNRELSLEPVLHLSE